jgi:hypothetical protein
MNYVILSLIGIVAVLVLKSDWNWKQQMGFILSAIIIGSIVLVIIEKLNSNIHKGPPSADDISWFEMFSYLCMVAGMAARYFFDAFGKGNKFRFQKKQFFRPLLISPIVFGIVYLSMDENTSKPLLLIFSFQNGFFWQTVLNKDEVRDVYVKNKLSSKNKTELKKTIKILFLAANPNDTNQLRLDEEMRDIDQALRQAKFRERFDIRQQWAVRVADLQGHFLRYQPDIIHFSGHGSKASEIILEDNNGNSQPVSNRALSDLFSVLKDNIRCVVLNACYTEKQAQAIAKHIDCVVGMSKAIGDPAAKSFAVAFYRGLGYGKDVKIAFELGRGQINLEGLDEQDTPKLLAINNKPEEIAFV